jgi:hypothetical protein
MKHSMHFVDKDCREIVATKENGVIKIGVKDSKNPDGFCMGHLSLEQAAMLGEYLDIMTGVTQ